MCVCGRTPLILGVRFTTAVPGRLTAVRFFKAAREGGSGHVGKVYDWASGRLLASTGAAVDDSFCGGPKWVSLPITTPIITAPDTQYVVAVDSLMHYVKSAAMLGSGRSSRDLSVVAAGGVYSTELGGGMPRYTDQGATNYWVDGEQPCTHYWLLSGRPYCSSGGG